MKSFSKILTTAIAAGLISGFAVYGGMSYHQDHVNDNGRVTEVQKTANVQNQSERAFKAIHNDVVSVINTKKVDDNELPGVITDGAQRKIHETSEGSGVIYKVSGDSAYLVTNDHVVDGASHLRVQMTSGKKVNAKVVGTDKKDDLAVVKMSSNGISQVAHFGNSDHIQAGETSLAIGSPLGATYASTVTKGIISDKSRKIKKVAQDAPQDTMTTHVIQTDTAINPGNSGGALINLDGQVIGINSAKVASTPQGTSVEGMGFAIPSNEVVRVINRITSKS